MPQVAEKERKMRPSSPPDIIINLLRLIFRKRKVLYVTIALDSNKEMIEGEPLISRVLCGRSEQ